MEALQLEYFRHAAQSQNFSHTAAAFGVPPSAVSQSIRRLERELGVLLFDRKSNRIALNENGSIFLRAVTQSRSILDHARRTITERKNEVAGSLRLCVLCSRRAIFDAVTQFTANHPKVSFNLDHAPLQNEEFDLWISDRPPENGIFVQTMLTEDISLALPKSHPLATTERIDLSQLHSERFITTSKNSSLCRLTVESCRNAGFDPEVVIHCDDPYYLRRYIELGLGIALVPTISWQGQFGDMLEIKPMNGITRTISVYRPTNRPLSFTAKTFIKELKN